MTMQCEFTKHYVNGLAISSFVTDNVPEMVRNIQSSVLSNFGDAPVYKIVIAVSEKKEHKSGFSAAYQITKFEYNFYIADNIQTDTQIYDSMQKQHAGNIAEIPAPINKQAILTNVLDKTYMAGGLQIGVSQPHVVKAGKIIDWHILNPKNDIVVDKNLHQIYPKKTGAFPTVIQKLLQKAK